MLHAQDNATQRPQSTLEHAIEARVDQQLVAPLVVSLGLEAPVVLGARRSLVDVDEFGAISEAPAAAFALGGVVGNDGRPLVIAYAAPEHLL